jgi:hypothetical protein
MAEEGEKDDGVKHRAGLNTIRVPLKWRAEELETREREVIGAE